MKIEINSVKKILEDVKDSSLRPVRDEPILADAYDKMFNFGVLHLFYQVLIRLDNAEKLLMEEAEQK